MKRVFIVHGWDGSPNELMHQHIKKELLKKGFEVFLLSMPNPSEPEIKPWVRYLSKSVGEVTNEDYFIGHSIGCQTVLRYIETLSSDSEVGGCLLIAPWMHLDENTLKEEPGSEEIARPWMETPINWDAINPVCSLFTCIFSDDDPYVPLSDAEIFQKNLDARVVILKSQGHFTDEDGNKSWPTILKEFYKISSN